MRAVRQELAKIFSEKLEIKMIECEDHSKDDVSAEGKVYEVVKEVRMTDGCRLGNRRNTVVQLVKAVGSYGIIQDPAPALIMDVPATLHAPAWDPRRHIFFAYPSLESNLWQRKATLGDVIAYNSSKEESSGRKVLYVIVSKIQWARKNEYIAPRLTELEMMNKLTEIATELYYSGIREVAIPMIEIPSMNQVSQRLLAIGMAMGSRGLHVRLYQD